MADERAVADFRRWLAIKLASSRWPVHRGDTDETMGKRLGVQPEMFAEARIVRAQMALSKFDGRRRLGMPKAADGKRPRYMIFIEPPEDIALDWRAYAKQRDMASAVLFRSALHHVMQLTWQPVDLHSGRKAWRYKGRWVGQTKIRDHDYRMKTEVNHALYTALTERALASGVSSGAIARWSVILLLEGRLEKTLWIVPNLGSLYKDPAEYCRAPEIKRIKE